MKTFWQEYKSYILQSIKNEPKAIIFGLIFAIGFGYFTSGWFGIIVYCLVLIMLVLVTSFFRGVWDDDPFYDD